MSKVIIKRCTPLGSKCTPHRPFVKWYRGVKRKRLHGDPFRITVEPVIVKKYRKTLANRGFCKKKLDTHFNTHCIKTGVQLWSEWRDLNPRPLGPEPSALPAALHPDRILFYYSRRAVLCQQKSAVRAQKGGSAKGRAADLRDRRFFFRRLGARLYAFTAAANSRRQASRRASFWMISAPMPARMRTALCSMG